MKTTYLNLHDKPNRRAEFWSDSDKGPVLVVNYRDTSVMVNELQQAWLTEPDFCIHICSSDELNQPTDSRP